MTKSEFACDNLKFLCDFKMILSLPCFMLVLKAVHTLIKYAQHQKVFIIDFVNGINLVEVNYSTFILNPFYSFDDLLFDDSFPKLIEIALMPYLYLGVYILLNLENSLFFILQDKCFMSTHVAQYASHGSRFITMDFNLLIIKHKCYYEPKQM